MNIDEIINLLPQQPPFLMLDRVLSYEPGKKLIALKNITINDPIFKGHFPGNPVVPGAILIESMAQTAILLYLSKNNFVKNNSENYYLGSVKARFIKSAFPGDQLRIEADLIKIMGNGLFISAFTLVENEKIAEAELICMIQK